MARISDDLFAQICSENDIVDYVSRYTQLKKNGRDYTGLCPFHSEKTPSFHVNREKQLFHCFGCGASGNLVQFIMRTEHLSFMDALQVLADHAGIIIPDKSVIDDKNSEQRKKILEMNRIAARFFFDNLKDPKLGNEAREYLKNRRISWKTITAYGLGFAPNSKDSLINFMSEKGYDKHQLIEASLAVKREDAIIDKFRNRVMFPIIDVRGNVIGFGGRVMHNEKQMGGYTIPKYLNSSETAAFDKGRNLFSLNLAKNSHEKELILCEGYMDVISVYQAGIKNIVATLGTAITPNQAKLMLRYASEIIICYDSDDAGKKAALRAIDIISQAGGRSKIMRLKGAKDPDEYIIKNGVAAFKNAVQKAVPATEFRISLIKSQYDLNDTDAKIKFISDASDILKSINDAVEVDAYIKKISEETGISKDAIYTSYKQKLSSKQDTSRWSKIENIKSNTLNKAVVSEFSHEPTQKENIPKVILEGEKRLLSLIASSKKLYTQVSSELKSSDFSTDIHRRIAKALYDCYQSGQTPDEAMILNEFSGDTQMENEASSVFFNLEVYSGDESAVKDLLYNIKIEKLNIKIKSEKDFIRLAEYMKEKEKLLKERNM